MRIKIYYPRFVVKRVGLRFFFRIVDPRFAVKRVDPRFAVKRVDPRFLVKRHVLVSLRHTSGLTAKLKLSSATSRSRRTNKRLDDASL